MKITVLADHPDNPPFCPEFGLSLLLRTGTRTILFDTGAGNALLPNLERLHIDPASLNTVILSHGHYDHTGGLAGINPSCIWCCAGIDRARCSRHEDGSIHILTMPEASRTVLNRAHIHHVSGFQEILPGIFLTGPIPRISGESCGGDFYYDTDCRTPDSIPEEQALLTADGILITGCCHAGIINTLKWCQQVHPEIEIREIAGGLHLLHADESRLAQVADYLKQTGIRQLCLLHCTGLSAVEYLQKNMPDSRFYLPRPGESVEM